MGHALRLPFYVLRTSFGLFTTALAISFGIAAFMGDRVLPRPIMRAARGTPPQLVHKLYISTCHLASLLQRIEAGGASRALGMRDEQKRRGERKARHACRFLTCIRLLHMAQVWQQQ